MSESVRDMCIVLKSDLTPVVLEWSGGARALTAAPVSARAAMKAFASAVRSAQEGEYLTAHRRLPGSTRTKRLRKKRADRVSAWLRQPSTPERGREIAELCNRLEFANDSARHFGLGVDLSTGKAK